MAKDKVFCAKCKHLIDSEMLSLTKCNHPEIIKDNTTSNWYSSYTVTDYGVPMELNKNNNCSLYEARDEKNKVFCKRCKYLRTLHLRIPAVYLCTHPTAAAELHTINWLRDSTEEIYGNPKELNKDNSCSYFEEIK